MKTKRKAIRKVTLVPPLEPVAFNSLDKRREAHGLCLQQQAVMGDTRGPADPMVVDEASETIARALDELPARENDTGACSGAASVYDGQTVQTTGAYCVAYV